MSNQELELKVKEILEIENFFDMTEAVIAFKKEYKRTDFYKKTKMPITEVIKTTKMWYMLQLKDIGEKIQGLINDLDFNKFNELLNQLGNVYSQENEETLNIFKEFKEIVK